MNIVADIERREGHIRSQLMRLPRRVIPGCIVKVKTSVVFGIGSTLCEYMPNLYGIVGMQLDICHSTTARGFQVDFNAPHIMEGMPYVTINEPVFENDMCIMRFPEQYVSLDDVNIDKLFKKIDGSWCKKELH